MDIPRRGVDDTVPVAMACVDRTVTVHVMVRAVCDATRALSYGGDGVGHGAMAML